MSSDSIFDQYFPLRKLGLRKNPFGTLSHEEWVAVTVPPPAIIQLVETGFDHLQIIGNRGHGKSTTLLWLCHYYTQSGLLTAYERLPRWQFYYQTDVQPLDYFALDEAQRLFFFHQHRLFRQMSGKQFIIGTHHSWERIFRWYGWSLTTVQIGDHTTLSHIRHILDKRLEVFATEQGAQVYFDASAVDYLWDKWRNNLRGMEWFLYHIMQKRTNSGAITATYLEQAGRDYHEPTGLY